MRKAERKKYYGENL